MPREDVAIVILAAGKGTRLLSKFVKVLHRAGGRTLIEHVGRACVPLEAAQMLVVVGHQGGEVRAAVTPLGAQTVMQVPQGGTGHAMLAARDSLNARLRYALVLPGDAPLVRTETLGALLEAHRNSGAAASLLTAELADPAGYGRILRHPVQSGSGQPGVSGVASGFSVSAIVEEKSATAEQRRSREINAGIYCFTLEKLWPALEKVVPQNVHREIYLTDAIEILNRQGEKVAGYQVPHAEEILGCNTRAELAEADRAFRRRKAAALMQAGVTLYLPETVVIDDAVEIGADSVIEPAVQLLGATRLGADCIVRTGSIILDSVLEDNVEVRPHCLISGSRLGMGVVTGPFAHIRDGADLRSGSRVGNYVEVKKSTLAEGVKAMHLSYLGDASIGRHTNIGAGTITCNYDGIRKNQTRVGERVFVGSGSELVAPVQVGDDAYIAAGSVITEEVPAGSLAIARGRQVLKPGWSAEHRARVAAKISAQPASEAAPEKLAAQTMAAGEKESSGGPGNSASSENNQAVAGPGANHEPDAPKSKARRKAARTR